MVGMEAVFDENRVVRLKDRLLRPYLEIVLVLGAQDDAIEERNIWRRDLATDEHGRVSEQETNLHRTAVVSLLDLCY